MLTKIIKIKRQQLFVVLLIEGCCIKRWENKMAAIITVENTYASVVTVVSTFAEIC
jgi:phage antirepressor YoqD-like protein